MDKQINGELLEKIEEFDNQEERMVIFSKINEKEWRLECERLSKTINEMTEKAKPVKKKKKVP